MKITVLAVGSLKEDYFRAAAAEYELRLTPYAQVQVNEVAESKVKASASPATLRQLMAEEGEALLRAIPAGSLPVALCIEAVPKSSLEFTAWLVGQRDGGQHLCFIIGGSHGLAPSVKVACRAKLSFGPLTLPHQLARIVLLEQIYRAFKIMRNEPYHK
ncbi:MAG: Ribosomal RNA large subunit methyltransferase H [Firmicutes bacterium]|nr:Ribosomal RNA large subunit methyltransferase H [Bacillota bacterium]